MEIFLKYDNHQPIINQCFQVSKASKKIYTSVKNISSSSDSCRTSFINPYKDQNPLGFMTGIYVLSTSRGIFSHYMALKCNVGGKILFYIS